MPRAKRPESYQIRVYDNGGETLDRYTVVIDGEDWDSSSSPGMKAMLGLSEGGRSFSQHTEGQEGPHLGRGIAFQSLDEQTQRHIIARLE